MGDDSSSSSSSSSSQKLSSTNFALDPIPDDVTMFFVVSYLSQYDVVRRLSATSKTFSNLARNRYEIFVQISLYSSLLSNLNTKAWTQVAKANFQGVGMGSHLLEFPNSATLLPHLKIVKLDRVHIVRIDLEAIQAGMKIEDLTFDKCKWESNLDIFPPNLTHLKIFCSPHGEKQQTGIKNLPETLKVFESEYVHLLKQHLLPEGLSNLAISGQSATRIPFSFPNQLQSLKIGQMPRLKDLPSLAHLNSLKRLKFETCPELTSTLALPSQLRIFTVNKCAQVKIKRIPAQLEELSCIECPALQFSHSSLTNLKRLTLSRSNHAKVMTQLDLLPFCLVELNLEGYDDLFAIPVLPICLRSFFVGSCRNLQRISADLRTLEKIELRDLPRINMIPHYLKYLIISNCRFQEFPGSIPFNLEYLLLENLAMFSFPDCISFPDTLTTLIMKNCPKGEINLIMLPSQLEYLHLEYSKGIKASGHFPVMLQSLILVGICDLDLPSEFPSTLVELMIERCSVSDSANLSRIGELPKSLRYINLGKSRLAEVIKIPKSLIESSKKGMRFSRPSRFTLPRVETLDHFSIFNPWQEDLPY